MPQMNIRIPPLTPILILFWAFGVWYVIRLYHFMVISPEMAVHEIVRQMDNMMFFLDEKGQITRINDQVTNVMISQEEELLGRPFMMIVQPDSALFTFARGGHPFPVLISQGRFEMLKGRGPMVGQFPGIQFEKVTCELRSGDRLFLYTDGLIEVSNRKNDLFGFKRFAELLLSSSHLPLENAMDRIMDEIRSFRGLSEVEDDMLITCIEYTGLE